MKFQDAFSVGHLLPIFQERILLSRGVGRDGVKADAFKVDTEILAISQRVLSKKYKFTPYKPEFVSKGAGKDSSYSFGPDD